MSTSNYLKIFVAVAIAGFAVSPVRASSDTWSNGSGNLQWDNTSLNWSGTTFANGDSATFTSTGSGTITVWSAISAAGITLSPTASGYVFTGGTLASTALVFANASAQFNDPVSFGSVRVSSGQTITFNGGGTLTPDGNPAPSGASGIMSFASGSYTLGNIISQNGGGTVNLTFTGTSTFSSATTQLGYTNPANLLYSSSGTSAFTNQIRIGRAGTGTLTQTLGTITASGETQLDGVGGNGTLDLQGGTYNAGTQQITIQAAQTSGTGHLILEGGSLTAGTIALNSGTGGSSIFELSSGNVKVNTINQANGGSKSIIFSGGLIGTNTSTSGTWSPNISLSGNVTINAATATGASAEITVSGTLSGAGGFTKSGGGALTLGAPNSYTGATIIAAGSLSASTTNAVASSGTIDIQTGATLDLAGAGIGTYNAPTTQSIIGSGTINQLGTQINIAGTLRPDDSVNAIGTLHLLATTGELTLANGASFTINLGNTLTDSLVSNAVVNLGAASGDQIALTINLTGQPVDTTVYTILSGASVNNVGTFTYGGMTLANGQVFVVSNNGWTEQFQVNYGPTADSLTALAIPEPASSALLMAGLCSLGCFCFINRRPA